MKRVVRANNPARRLYERVGFVTVAEITNRVGGASFVTTLDLRLAFAQPRDRVAANEILNILTTLWVRERSRSHLHQPEHLMR